MKKPIVKKSKPVDFEDYDKSKYKSWLQQKYAQLYGQEILLRSEIEAFSNTESKSLDKERYNGEG